MIRHLVAFLLLTSFTFAAESKPYDPLKVSGDAVTSLTFEVADATRDRTLPLRVYLPESAQPAPVILFSHGLGGSRDNNPYLGNHWAKRGYLVVFVQHPGSDEAVWKSQPALKCMAAMKKAASFENVTARGQDLPRVIQTLTTWNQQPQHPLHGRMNLEKIGMSGHSFGANTTQSVAGQNYPGGRISFTEPRIDAAVMMSPGPPALGDPAKAFGDIRIPCLLLTGTRDDSPIGKQTPADRLKVFPHLRQAPAWQVVFEGATHMDFGQRSMRGEAIQGTRYHQAILALTTAFWDATLQANPAATAWLNGKAARSVLQPEDVWQWNGR
jgi:predicted dienelactone hydrolase